MSRIVFDTTADAAPYDLDGVTTGWRLAGGATHPAPTTGLLGSAQTFDGTAGYEADDDGDALMAFQRLVIRVLCRPDFDALDGTRVSLVARGKGGPTVAEGWGWDLRLNVAAGAATADIELAWSDESVVEVVHVLGTMNRPASDAWTVIAVNREVVADGVILRCTVNGSPLGSQTVTDQVPATPAQVVTLGCRRNGAAYERFFAGDIEAAEILETSTGDAGERAYAASVLDLPGATLDAVRDYWFTAESVVRLRDSTYESYRLRPLATLASDARAAVRLRATAGLPNTAHGDRLEAWEAALGLTGGERLSVVERQERAASAMALVEGIGAPFLSEYGCTVVGAATPLAAFLTVLQLEPDYLWVGTDTDVVAGEVLTASGSAGQGTDADLPLSTPWGREALTFTAGATDVWATSDATIADMDGTEPVAVLLAYYLDARPGALNTLIGKRDEAADFVGWEINVNSADELLAWIDSGVPPVVPISLSTLHTLPGWHVVIARHDPDAQTWDAATELESQSVAFTTPSASSTVPLSWGAYRSVSTPAWRSHVVAVWRGARVAGFDLRAIANKVYDAISHFDPVIEFRRAVNLDPTILCIGQTADAVTRTSMTVEGTATSAIITDVSGAFGTTAYSFDGTNGASFTSDDDTLGGIPAAESRAYFVIFRPDSFNSAYAIAGKQNGPDEGYSFIYELGLDAYRIRFETELATSISLDLTPTSSVVGEWRCLCAVFDRVNAEIRFASDLEAAATVALPAERIDPPGFPLRIGDSRVPPSAVESCEGDVALFAEVQDGVPDIDPQTAAAALLAWFLGD